MLGATINGIGCYRQITEGSSA
ncbi:hypothetical protein SGPA1_50112 [Streptomyces misionensis JCM 4497]